MGKVGFGIGEFDRRVDLLRQEMRRTDTGSVTKEFVHVGSVYGKVSVKTREEGADGLRVLSQDVCELAAYDVAGVDNSWRVEVAGVVYEVLSVERLRRRFMVLVIKRV